MVHMVERFYVLGSRVARLALFRRLGESPARASEEKEREPASFEICFGLPLWEGSGPETSFTEEDHVFHTRIPHNHNAS